MDVGIISIVLVLGLIFLLGIGMPLGFASAFLALVVMIMKFEPSLLLNPFSFGEGLLTGNPGTGPLYILTQKIFDLLTEYVLISVPLFIFMAALLERSGVAKQMYDSLDFWLSRVRGGVAIVTSLMAVIMAAMSGIIGGEVVLLGLIALPQMLRQRDETEEHDLAADDARHRRHDDRHQGGDNCDSAPGPRQPGVEAGVHVPRDARPFQ